MKKLLLGFSCTILTGHAIANTTVICSKSLSCDDRTRPNRCHITGDADKYFASIYVPRNTSSTLKLYLTHVSAKINPDGKSVGICTYTSSTPNPEYTISLSSLLGVSLIPDIKESSHWIGDQNKAECSVYAGDGSPCSLIANYNAVRCSKDVECTKKSPSQNMSCHMTENTLSPWFFTLGRPQNEKYFLPGKYNFHLAMVKVTKGKFTDSAECTYVLHHGHERFDAKIMGYKIEPAIPESETGTWQGSEEWKLCMNSITQGCLLRISPATYKPDIQ